MAYTYRSGEIPVSEGLRSGLNSTGSSIAAGLVVKGGDDSISLPAANTDAVFGVTRKAIADGTRGPIMKMGRAICTAGTSGVAAGVRVMPEAATGKVITWTSGNAIVGMTVRAAVADAEVEVDLAGSGDTAQ